MLFGYLRSLKSILFCSAEDGGSCKFGMSWGWINDKKIIFICGQTFTLMSRKVALSKKKLYPSITFCLYCEGYLSLRSVETINFE